MCDVKLICTNIRPSSHFGDEADSLLYHITEILSRFKWSHTGGHMAVVYHKTVFFSLLLIFITLLNHGGDKFKNTTRNWSTAGLKLISITVEQ